MKLPFKLPTKAEERSRIVSPFIGLAVALLFAILYLSGPLKNLFNTDLDMKFKLRQAISKAPTNKDVIIVEIEETTLEWENTFPDDPVYYQNLIEGLGKDYADALATVFAINYYWPYGRKLNTAMSFSDIPIAVQDLSGKIQQVSSILTQDAQLQTQLLQNAGFYGELLGEQDAATNAPAIAAKLDEILFDPNMTTFSNYMQQVAAFAENESSRGGLAPNREKVIATAATTAKNVYFTYDAKNRLDSPYDIRDLKESKRIRKIFERIITYPTKNRPEDPIEGAVFDAYENALIKDFDYLMDKKKGEPFKASVIEMIKKDKEEKAAELAEFHKQNDKWSFPVPKKLKGVYVELRKVKPVWPEIGEQVAGQGIRKAEFTQGDGTMRLIAPVVEYDGRLYPHIDLLVAMKYLGVKPKDVVFSKNKIVLKNARDPKTKTKRDVEVPLINGMMLINWTGMWADTSLFRHMSFRNLYNSLTWYSIKKKQESGQELTPEESENLSAFRESDAVAAEKMVEDMKGRILIVGLTATGAADTNPTPLEPRYKVLGLHANVINTIVTNQFILSVNQWFVVLIFFVLAVGLGSAGGAVKHKSSIIVALINATLMFFFAALYAVFCNYMFIKFRYNLPLLAPIILVVGTFLLVFLFRYITEEQEKKKMKGMFSTYVNPQVVDTLVANPDKLQLGGERMHATVFFSDIAGFTTISESMTPEELVELLNEYLTAMTNILMKYGGTLDKYIGDAIVGIFGAPIPFPEHAKNCCYTAIEMQEKLAELRVGWAERGKPDIQVRCGVNTGDMICGNMGSIRRFNYTAMGPAVELGEHLESGGKNYDTQKLISEFTKVECDEFVITRLLDIIWVAGYEKPVKIYELIEKKEVGIPDDLEKGLRLHEEAVIFYFQRKWDESLAKLEEVYKYIPGDPPSKKLEKKLKEAKENTPDESFDEILKQANHRNNLVF